MNRTNVDWQQEFEEFSKSGFSRPQYCKKKGLKYSSFRYHWERRAKIQQKEEGFVEVPQSVSNGLPLVGSEFLTLKIDSSGKALLQVNLQFSLGQWS
ncbi:hypothetical protein LEP1GSC047_1368 [Leptospira inadai serovar Lyme str. 10]|uniref:Transposase n=2 Tax=Leptospira inadai serovar Lyme TaxID=293084 RepID=V6H8S0_9LEPT|nr:hypothetical protein [Leptospira inadai]EQA35356.1 hypothetical protein LEP1GSC047_1368 [Leptospira inadai serovar Lyme str. 10]PNV71621.1 hypothetical protein BES34_021230 [Leptospira inadai serovar Lyme]PNV76083.1 hypothetical protein BES34_006195 [Leptospira inadai serovar Lyme]